MSRFASSANENEAEKTSIVMCTMVDLDFPSGHLYAHDSVGTLVFGGHSYLGVGQFGGIQAIEEDIDVISKPLVLTLSGADPSLITSEMTENCQGRKVVVYVAVFNKDTMQFIDTPETAGTWRMDYAKIDIDAGKATITLNCESRLRQSPRISLQTDQDQQIAHPGDTFYNRITFIANYKSNWGAIIGVSYHAPTRTPPGRFGIP